MKNIHFSCIVYLFPVTVIINIDSVHITFLHNTRWIDLILLDRKIRYEGFVYMPINTLLIIIIIIIIIIICQWTLTMNVSPSCWPEYPYSHICSCYYVLHFSLPPVCKLNMRSFGILLTIRDNMFVPSSKVKQFKNCYYVFLKLNIHINCVQLLVCRNGCKYSAHSNIYISWNANCCTTRHTALNRKLHGE
jgi:hypothetical protein